MVLRERCECEPEHLKQGTGFVLYAQTDAVVDRYFPMLDALEIDVEKIECQIFERGAACWNIERLYDLKPRASVLRHTVAPLLKVVGKPHGQRVPAGCARSQERRLRPTSAPRPVSEIPARCWPLRAPRATKARR